jgi:hypothetical protein
MNIYPSQLKNFILRDPLIDYLEYYKINNIDDVPSRKRTISTESTEFEDFVMKRGIEYEKNVIENFPIEICKIEGTDKFNNTLKALQDNVPVIYQGYLIDEKNNTCGYPDIIIKGKYLNVLYNQNEDEDKYYIIDIKSSTIELSSDQSYVLNSDLQQVYKSQILVYTNALNNLLNQNVTKGFILAKKYTFTKSNNKIIESNNSFNKIISIDYESKNSSKYIDIVKNAVQWIIKLQLEGFNWRLFPKPSVPELYPNMSNRNDERWHSLKKEIAYKLKELTLIVNVGYEQRKLAFAQGIYSYDDPRCNSSIFNLKENKALIVDSIIDINSDNCTDLIKTSKIKFNELKENQIEFYLDYETTTDFDNDTFIFMIGVGHYTTRWKFRTFILKKNTIESQKEMFAEFWDYINTMLTRNNKTESIFVHWTDAEPSCYNKIKNKLNLPIKNFLDLYKLFIKEPIVIKGAFDYSIKTIAKAMYKNKMIKTMWDSKSKCSNGLDALIIASKLYSNNKDIKIKDLKDIIYYNEIDCKVLFEIKNYFIS